MTLMLSMVAIVAIVLFVIFDYLPALLRIDAKSKQTKKEMECGFVVQPQNVPKLDPNPREPNMAFFRPDFRSNQSLPKHKRDPRIFVDNEEIGHEPYE